MITIAVVILNWNGRHHLQQFLPSVCTYSDFPGTQIIVADNGSSDDSVSFLQKNFPSVRILSFGKNHGFALGYCMALEQIEATYYLLLNSDVEVTPGWLVSMYHAMEKNPALGACMPKILSYDR